MTGGESEQVAEFAQQIGFRQPLGRKGEDTLTACQLSEKAALSGIEDAFNFVKPCLGWEEVHLLDLRGIGTFVALTWVAAGFLFELGVTIDWVEVQVVAKLGGFDPKKGRTPGQLTLQRGLSRLLEMLTTQAILSDSAAHQQGLPPTMAAF